MYVLCAGGTLQWFINSNIKTYQREFEPKFKVIERGVKTLIWNNNILQAVDVVAIQFIMNITWS